MRIFVTVNFEFSWVAFKLSHGVSVPLNIAFEVTIMLFGVLDIVC